MERCLGGSRGYTVLEAEVDGHANARTATVSAWFGALHGSTNSPTTPTAYELISAIGKGICVAKRISPAGAMVTSGKLWVVVNWKGDVVHVADLARGQCFSLGVCDGDWPFPETLLGSRSRTLVDYRNEAPRVLEQDGHWQRLTPGQRLRTEWGPFCVTTTMGDAAEDACDFRRQKPDLQPLLYWLGSAASQLALLAAMIYATPTLTDVEVLPTNEAPTWLVQQYLGGDAEPESGELEELLGIVTTELPFAHPILGASSRCVGYTTMGRRGAAAADLRYAVEGPKDNPDPHIARQRAVRTHALQSDLVGIGASVEPGDPNAHVAPWGRDTSLGTDEVSARGQMWGEAIGDAPGEDGGLKSSLEGGVVKRIELVRENLAESRPARVMHAQSSVSGSLRLDAIEMAVASRLAAFRDCYRADPSSHGDHEAHLEVGLDIKSTGEVAQVRVLTNQQVTQTLLACVLERAKTVTFPHQVGDSQVTYPLHFIPAMGESSSPVVPIALAREVPRETELPSPCAGPAPPRIKVRPCPR